jgi:hypothetical protein
MQTHDFSYLLQSWAHAQTQHSLVDGEPAARESCGWASVPVSAVDDSDGECGPSVFQASACSASDGDSHCVLLTHTPPGISTPPLSLSIASKIPDLWALVSRAYNPKLLRRQRSGGLWARSQARQIVHETLS